MVIYTIFKTGSSGMEPPTREQVAGAALDAMTRDYTLALAEVNGSIRRALALVVRAERIEGVDAQQLSEWLNLFEIEMGAFGDLCRSWTDEVENAGPIADWRVSDLDGIDLDTVPLAEA